MAFSGLFCPRAAFCHGLQGDGCGPQLTGLLLKFSESVCVCARLTRLGTTVTIGTQQRRSDRLRTGRATDSVLPFLPPPAPSPCQQTDFQPPHSHSADHQRSSKAEAPEEQPQHQSGLLSAQHCPQCDASGWSPWAEQPAPITPILGLTFPPQHPAVQVRPEKPEGECGPLGPQHLLAPPLLPPEGQGQQLSETCQVLTGGTWCPNQLNNQEGSLPLQLYHPALSGGTWEESRTQV